MNKSASAVSPDALTWLAALAVRAGQGAMVHYHDGVAVRQKGDKGPVTAADHASHAVIVEELAAWDLSRPVISEGVWAGTFQ